MLKDKWEDKHGINLPAHTSCPNNMVLQPLQGLSDNDHLTGSSSKINVAALASPGLNLQDGKFGFPVNQPTSIEPAGFKHQFDSQFPRQSHFSEARAGQSLVDSNLQQLITFLSANYGPMKAPLEMGTPEYLKLVEILKQSSANGGGSSVEKLSGGLKETGSYSKDGGTDNIQNVETASLTGGRSTGGNNQEKISSSEKAAEQLWEGSLQLSSSVTLSAVAFFKSGEKLVGNNWPEFIEVKGKVRLEAFEKYVQDLPRSRNRGLMVTSICWNEGSSNIGLNGMKEVAKGYKKSSRVGFAQLLSGIDLYICPRSDPIITILAKYGFFKGMSVLDDKPDSMIGCVVWRKNRPLNPVGDPSDGKSSPSLTQPQGSPPGFSSKQDAETKLSPEKAESSQGDEPLTFPLTIACPELDHNRGSSSSSAEVDPCNLVLKKRSFQDDDLPEFDFGVSCGKSTLVSKPLNSPNKLDNTPLIQSPSVVNVVERNKVDIGSLKPSLKKPKLFDDDDMPEWRPPELLSPPTPQITTSNFQNLPVYPVCPPPPPPIPPPQDDMPEWRPPEINNPPTPQITTSNFQNLPVYPLRPPPPPPIPPPRSDTRSSFSYLPFQPPVSSQPPAFVRPLPPPPPRRPPPSSSGRFSSNQVLWHQPSFPSSSGRGP